MADHPFLADVDALLDAFARTDDRMPAIVFALLARYRAEGPFAFEADGIAAQLNATKLKARVNPEEIAALQGDIETFFEPRADGLAPRAALFPRLN